MKAVFIVAILALVAASPGAQSSASTLKAVDKFVAENELAKKVIVAQVELSSPE